MVLVVTIPGFIRTEQISRSGQQTASQEVQDNANHIAAEKRIISGLRRDVRCITTWVNAYTSSSREIQARSTERLDLLFKALNAAVEAQHKKSLKVYHKASLANQAYHRYLRHNPIPGLKLACSVPDLPVVPDPPTRTVTVTPAPRTVTPAPRTVTQTPARRTVTAHPAPRTVTVTTTVPPGKDHTVTQTVTTTATPTICKVTPALC